MRWWSSVALLLLSISGNFCFVWENALSPFRNLLLIWNVVLIRLTGCQIQAPLSPAPLFRAVLPNSDTLSPSPLHPRSGSVDVRVCVGCAVRAG